MTRSNFAKLPIEQFFLLFKEYQVWSANFLEDYLAQYEAHRGIKINDSTWNALFMDISTRLL